MIEPDETRADRFDVEHAIQVVDVTRRGGQSDNSLASSSNDEYGAAFQDNQSLDVFEEL